MQNLMRDLSSRQDMEFSYGQDGTGMLQIHGADGEGQMCFYMAAPGFIIALVDFAISRCPSVKVPDLDYSGWITLNHCKAGRCEVTQINEKAIIVKPGDCCITGCSVLAEEYLYPTRHYQGMELLIHESIMEDPSFSLLHESGFDIHAWNAHLRHTPALIDGDRELNTLLGALEVQLEPFDKVGCKLKMIEVLRYINRCDLASVPARTYYSKSQINMAKQVCEMLITHPDKPYSLSAFAQQYGVSVGTLNNIFKAVYGQYIPAYIRSYRMQSAADRLTGSDVNVYEIALSLGYSNPGKFSAAFKKEMGDIPTEFRRKARLRRQGDGEAGAEQLAKGM